METVVWLWIWDATEAGSDREDLWHMDTSSLEIFGLIFLHWRMWLSGALCTKPHHCGVRIYIKCVSLFSNIKLEDLLKDHFVFKTFSWGQYGSYFFSSPLAVRLAAFISISLLPTQQLKLQHVLGLFHFMKRRSVQQRHWRHRPPNLCHLSDLKKEHFPKQIVYHEKLW